MINPSTVFSNSLLAIQSLGTPPNPFLAFSVGKTCLLGAEQIWLYRIAQTIPGEVDNLQNISTLPQVLSLPSNVQNTLAAWINGINALLTGANSNPSDIISMVYGLTPDNPGDTNINTVNSDFISIYNTVNIAQAANPTGLVDTARRAMNAVSYLASLYGNNSVTIGFIPGFMIPAIINQLQLAGFAPKSSNIQQEIVWRNALLYIGCKILYLAAIYIQPLVSTPNIVYSYSNDDLMDISARNLGNFENYSQLIAANPSLVAADVLGPGEQIFLQPQNSNVAPNPQNVLGQDIFLQQTPWTGDFQTIFGLENLAYALERRLQTAIGSLTYEETYGSRIPPEIGKVAGAQTMTHLLAFAEAAVKQDPRVSAVASAQLKMSAPGLFEIAMGVLANTGQKISISTTYS